MATWRDLPLNDTGVFSRAFLVSVLSVKLEELIDRELDPKSEIPIIVEGLRHSRSLLSSLSEDSFSRKYINRKNSNAENSSSSAEQSTAKLYGSLFADFDVESWLNEAAQLFNERLDLNKVSLDLIQGKSVLDGGCGGGRYSGALARLGAGQVEGVDLSERNIETATARAREAGLTNVNFTQGSVLDLPFTDEKFDFVLSNGVLHHTKDPQKGLEEVARDLKSGGILFYHIAEKLGFIAELTLRIRELVADVPQEAMIAAMAAVGFDENRRFYFIDPWFAPIRYIYSA